MQIRPPPGALDCTRSASRRAKGSALALNREVAEPRNRNKNRQGGRHHRHCLARRQSAARGLRVDTISLALPSLSRPRGWKGCGGDKDGTASRWGGAGVRSPSHRDRTGPLCKSRSNVPAPPRPPSFVILHPRKAATSRDPAALGPSWRALSGWVRGRIAGLAVPTLRPPASYFLVGRRKTEANRTDQAGPCREAVGADRPSPRTPSANPLGPTLVKPNCSLNLFRFFFSEFFFPEFYF